MDSNVFNSIDSDEDEMLELPNFDVVSIFLNAEKLRDETNFSTLNSCQVNINFQNGKWMELLRGMSLVF